MTNKEILTKILKRAVNNGYKLNQGLINSTKDIDEMCSSYKNGYLKADTVDGYECYDYSIKDIIFSHGFAIAFWGNELLCNGQTKKQIINELKTEIDNDPLDIKMCDYEIERDFMEGKYYFEVPNWEYHLQKMVIQKEPLKYLEQFLDK